MWKVIFLALMILPAFPALAANHSDGADKQVTLESLEKRIQHLEQIQEESFRRMNEGSGDVRTFLRKSGILLGGYFETAVTHIDGPNTTEQDSINSDVVGLNLTANFSDRDRFVMQLQTGIGYSFNNPHNDPSDSPSKRQFTSGTVSTLLPQAYYEHNFSPLFNIQSGIGYAPFGYAYQLREPFLFVRRQGPQMLGSQSTASVGVAFPLFMGIHIHGQKQLGNNRLGYNIYTFSPPTNARTIGVGSRLWFRFGDYATIGISHQLGRILDDTYQSYGADLDVHMRRYGVTVEYAENDSTGSWASPKSFYIRPYMEFFKKKWLLFLTADYLDNPSHVTGSNYDPYTLWDRGGGINWLPFTNTRVRLSYIDSDYVGNNAVKQGQNRDDYTVDLSLAVAF